MLKRPHRSRNRGKNGPFPIWRPDFIVTPYDTPTNMKMGSNAAIA